MTALDRWRAVPVEERRKVLDEMRGYADRLGAVVDANQDTSPMKREAEAYCAAIALLEEGAGE